MLMMYIRMLAIKISGTETMEPCNTNKAADSRINTFPDHNDGTNAVMM